MKTSVGRITKDLIELSKITETPGKGVTRSAYSKEDKQARDYLIKEMRKLNLKVSIDGVGTVFARKDGTNNELPAIIFGSHYDTVVNGGAFDGAAGTVAALECMRTLVENNYSNKCPLVLIAMNAEEGETFGPSTGVTNSRAMVGTLTMDELNTVKNRFGQTKLEAMKDYGLSADLNGSVINRNSISNFIEMHIEQGPMLEKENTDIGLIEFLPGIGRFKVRFFGETADSTAPMLDRKDALVAASKFITEFDSEIKKYGKDVTGMVGRLDIVPNSNQFVPEYVEGKIEIRTFNTAITKTLDFKQMISVLLGNIEKETGIHTEMIEIKRIGYSNPTAPSMMNKENVEIMGKICEDLGYSHMIINNGTGHDSMIMADYTDTNMIYVPSKNGVSHCPQEWTDYAAIKKGADVMLGLIQYLNKR